VLKIVENTLVFTRRHGFKQLAPDAGCKPKLFHRFFVFKANQDLKPLHFFVLRQKLAFQN
jgi:hypothetical protein